MEVKINMSVSVVVGGQFGSEGKGKVSYYFARKLKAVAVVRVGGTNSGHTVISKDGKEYKFRILPTSAIDQSIMSILPSGSYIDIGILKKEVKISGIKAKNLKIDENAVIIDRKMITTELQSDLQKRIGSTQSGTGEAVIRRLSRTNNILFAKDCKKILKNYATIIDTKKFMRDNLAKNKHIIIEGTQGFGLSPINSKYYPYCTSRDTTAAGFLMEAGLSPFDVENVIMAIRAYPIRVSGNSGELPKETNWEKVTLSSGANNNLVEYTTVTNNKRRVAEFDAEVVKRAILVNKPNIIVLNHVDYIDYSCHDLKHIPNKVSKFINKITISIGQHIDYVGTGKSMLLSIKRK